jgi:hypothetical protein
MDIRDGGALPLIDKQDQGLNMIDIEEEDKTNETMIEVKLETEVES